MKLLFAFGIIPVPVFYVNWSWMIGDVSPLVCIFILKKYRENVGLHRHALMHIEHAYCFGLLPFALLYLLCRSFRLKEEVAGYQMQMKYPGADGLNPLTIEEAAKYLSENYRLRITTEEAMLLLKASDP